MLSNQYFIIRKGDFATDGNKKIYYSLFSIALGLEEYINRNSLDCFTIMIGSTFIWTIIEFFLHITKTRVIKPMYVTDINKKKYLLPKPVSIFLQGFQEGGVVTTFGLYFGDRLFDFHYCVTLHLFILYIVINMNAKQNISKIASRRHINAPGSVCGIGIITIYNMITLYQHPEHFQRQLKMVFVMTYVCSIWTYIAYKKGFRSVEAMMQTPTNVMIRSNHPLDAFLVLGYDVLFEISIAYLTFYNWFIL